MLKIGQNWGKIANYPPQYSTKIGTTGKMPLLGIPKTFEQPHKIKIQKSLKCVDSDCLFFGVLDVTFALALTLLSNLALASNANCRVTTRL